MAAGDYRLMTETTGQRIATALEAQNTLLSNFVNLGDPVTIAHGGHGASTVAGALANLSAVGTIEQTLTSAQQQQARTNLSVYSESETDSAIQQSTASAILALDIEYSNVSVPATGSTNVSYTVPTRDGYSRVWVTLWRVSGSGTGNLVTTIHGDAAGGTIYLSSGSGNAITANFTLRVFYVKSGLYSNIT